MQGLAEGLGGASRNDDVVELVAIIEGVAAQLAWYASKGDSLQFVTLGEGVALHLLHTGREIDVIQFVTIVESIVLDLLYGAGDDDILELLLASERHFADDLNPLWDGEASLVAHAIDEAFHVGGIYSVAVKLKIVAVDLLQGKVEH